MFSLTQTGYDAIAQDLNAAIEWAQARGARISRSRFSEYRSIIQRTCDAWNASDGVERKYPTQEEMNEAFLEANKLHRIWKAFENQDSPGLRKRLAAVIDGPVMQADESASNSRGRNFALELDIVSGFIVGGIEFDLEDEADATLYCSGVRYFLEAKRPQTLRKFPHAVSQSRRQLTSRLASALIPSRGLIGLSLEKGFGAAGPIIRAESRSDLAVKIQEALTWFDRTYVTPQLLKHADQGVGGAVLHLPYVAYISDEPLVTGLQQNIVSAYRPGSPGSRDMRMLYSSAREPR